MPDLASCISRIPTWKQRNFAPCRHMSFTQCTMVHNQHSKNAAPMEINFELLCRPAPSTPCSTRLTSSHPSSMTHRFSSSKCSTPSALTHAKTLPNLQPPSSPSWTDALRTLSAMQTPYNHIARHLYLTGPHGRCHPPWHPVISQACPQTFARHHPYTLIPHLIGPHVPCPLRVPATSQPRILLTGSARNSPNVQALTSQQSTPLRSATLQTLVNTQNLQSRAAHWP